MDIFGKQTHAGTGRTAAQTRFATIPEANIPRSVFDRSCGLKTAFDSGYLVPIFADEALPGDTMNMRLATFCRMATPLTPFMDNAKLDIFFFAVPLRLVWDNFQKFMGEQDNPGDSTDFTIPQMNAPVGGYTEESLSDYLGLPIAVDPLSHSSLWHRAYNLIWNEWFRSEDLQNSVVVDKDDGPDDPADYVLKRRGKRHDYFTSALPFAQKGAAVELPLGTSAPVVPTSPATAPTFDFNSGTATAVLEAGGGGAQFNASFGRLTGTGPASGNDAVWLTTGLETDLTTATAATINQLREAFQIQKLYERDARGGTRYTEVVRSHFGVVSPDARLQRPEYLGGSSQNINVNPISNTSGLGVQGQMGAFVTSMHNSRGWTKSFTEHCVIIGLANVRADITYSQGLPRMFSRETKFDFYWPALAHLGEQAVLSKEIYADGTAADDDVWGYQERWAEYRYKPSTTTGHMRPQSTASLDVWHLGLDFGVTRPVLNAAFIEDQPPFERVIAVTNATEFLFDAFFQYKCVRPMPTYSVPGLIDHF